MTPQRKWEEHGHTVREYVWNGEVIVYVNGELAPGTCYETAVTLIEMKMIARRLPPPKNERDLP